MDIKLRIKKFDTENKPFYLVDHEDGNDGIRDSDYSSSSNALLILKKKMLCFLDAHI